MYRIKYNYDTGDSFSNEYGLEDYIETEFESVELAHRNARNIQEHYQMYRELNSWKSKGSHQEICQKYSDREWFVSKKMWVVVDGNYSSKIDESRVEEYKKVGREVREEFDYFNIQHNLKLFLENGKEIKYYCPWCGYFETLNFVEVEAKINNNKYFI